MSTYSKRKKKTWVEKVVDESDYDHPHAYHGLGLSVSHWDYYKFRAPEKMPRWMVVKLRKVLKLGKRKFYQIYEEW